MHGGGGLQSEYDLSWLETTPSWFARFAAWAVPSERPSAEAIEQATLAAAELWVGRCLARAIQAVEELPFAVEAALRSSSADSLDVGAWLSVLDGLRSVDPACDPTATGALPIRVAEAMGCRPTFASLLEASGAGDVPEDFVAAVGQLLAEQGPLTTSPLCWVDEVVKEEGTEHVRLRRLVGTGHPGVQIVSMSPAPPMPSDRLVFWDGDGVPLVVPRWLARWDAETGQVRWYNGRDPDGRVRYRGWWGPVLLARMPEDAPVFLRDDGLATPEPPGGLPPTFPSTPAGQDRRSATVPMAGERLSLPPAADPTAHPFTEADPLVLRVVTTRYVLRFARVEPGVEVIIGRNSDDASFVLAHHQLSRAHTRVRLRGGVVWVSDLGSTNGTQLAGESIGREEHPVSPGDIISAGPVWMRLERIPEDQLQRMETVTNLRPSPERDPLTRLLLPKHLGAALPPSLQGSFQDGDEVASGAESLWGVVLRIDRLQAIHAQLGAAISDAAFAITARLVQGFAPDPLQVTRLGYGELLVPLVGVDEGGAREEARRLVQLVRDQPWEAPLARLSLTAGIGEKRTEEGAGAWVARIRAGLPAPSHSSPSTESVG